MSLDLFVYSRKKNTNLKNKIAKCGIDFSNWLWGKFEKCKWLKNQSVKLLHFFEDLDPNEYINDLENYDCVAIFFELKMLEYVQIYNEDIKEFIRFLDEDIKANEVTLEHVYDLEISDLKYLRIFFNDLLKNHQDDIISIRWS